MSAASVRSSRLVAASLLFAGVDAHAHGSSGLEWIAVPFLIAVGGVFATIIVCAVMARGDWTLRLPLAIAWAVADVVLSVGGTWIFGILLQALVSDAWRGSDAFGKTIVWTFPLIAWSLPAALFLYWSRRG